MTYVRQTSQTTKKQKENDTDFPIMIWVRENVKKRRMKER